jgi:hypothetical protein
MADTTTEPIQPTQPAPQHKRSMVLIDREFQLRFISRLGVVLFFYLLVFLLISVVAPVAFTLLGDAPDWALTETAFRVEVLLRLILAPLLCTFLCLFAHGVIETFRIAGPNYRFKAVLRDLAKLRVPRGVTTRRGDYLRDTAVEFDKALIVLHDGVRDLKRLSTEASARTREALQDAPQGEAAAAALAALDEIGRRLARYELVSAAPQCRPLEGDGAPVEPMVEAVAAGTVAAR